LRLGFFACWKTFRGVNQLRLFLELGEQERLEYILGFFTCQLKISEGVRKMHRKLQKSGDFHLLDVRMDHSCLAVVVVSKKFLQFAK
jgi:hypothetical protein